MWQNLFHIFCLMKDVIIRTVRDIYRNKNGVSQAQTQPSGELPVPSVEKTIPQGLKMTKKEEFISVLPVLTEQGFDPYIPFTHAWHESGNFTRVIGQYNCLGIKKPKIWDGKIVTVLTHEYINGKKVPVTGVFIDFATMENFFLWYGDLIYRLYPFSWQNRNNYQNYFLGLMSGKFHYSTHPEDKHPNYPEKLILLYEQLKQNKVIENETKTQATTTT